MVKKGSTTPIQGYAEGQFRRGDADFVAQILDVGFRVGQSAAEGVIARRLFPLQLIVCAAPAYLSQHGAPENLNALAAHRCSVFRHPGTGKIAPWYVKVADGVVEQHVVPALCVNDEGLETEAVLAGHMLGLLTGIAAAAHIRTGRLVPLLTANVADQASVFVYYGSRAAQPARVRAFIDLAVSRLVGNPAFVLTAKELAAAEARGRKAYGRR